MAERGGALKDKRVSRQPPRDPLILVGHGFSLRIEAGTLLVRNGFTHFPQKQETYRYFKGYPSGEGRLAKAGRAAIVR